MLKIFKNLTKKDYLLILCSFIFIVFGVFLDLKVPEYMSSITRLLQSDNTKIISIIIEGVKMLVCTLGSLTSAIIVGYLTSWLSSNFSFNVRKKIFDKVCSFSTKEIKEFKTSSLITRTTNDVTQVEMFLAMGLQLLIKSPIMAIWAISKILNKSIKWSMLTGACVIILLITVFTLFIIVFPKFEVVQKLIDKVNNTIGENLKGIRVIRAFNAEKYTVDKFNKINDDLTNTQLFIGKRFSILNPIMNLVMHGLTLGIYVIGAIIINKANMLDKITLFSDMLVFSSYGIQVIASFLMLALIFMIWPRANVSMLRINEVLEKELSIKDTKNEVNSNNKGVIEFKNVSFKYPDADLCLLENISFKVNAGETIAFIGSTGSGKSTLVNLIPRFYDVTKGSILVDGIDVKDYKLKDLRKKIGYISQKAIIFKGTIKSNVMYGTEIKDEKRLNEALEIAQASEFVNKMDKGVNSIISQSGTNLSGGQKQRLSIARAIYKNPSIFIFDDSFSALDYKTDLKLREALKEKMNNKTTLIVAQRIGTIMNADKIIVLDNGKCVGIGTHKYLLKHCDVYKEIAYSQLSKEELNNA